MDERALQFRVGVLVVATVVIGVILILMFEELPASLGSHKTVYVHFQSAPGVTVGTPVRKSGILIGRVTDVELQDDGGVLVTIRLDRERAVHKNEICRISTGNLLGDAMLEFVPVSMAGKNEPLEDGAYLEGTVTKDAMAMMTDAMQTFADVSDDLQAAMRSVTTAGVEITDGAKNLNALLVNNHDQLQRIMGKTETALDRFDTTMVAVQEMVTDEELRLQLKNVLEQVPQVLTDTSQVMAGLGRVADEAEKNLVYLQGVTRPLGENGEQIVSSVQQSLDRLDTVLLQLQQFSQAINNADGTLGKLVHDPDLYQHLNQAAVNIEELTFRMQPVVDDARVISDKLARDPARIFRGALGPQRSGLK